MARCDVELELVSVPHGAGVALVVQDVRINDEALPMLRGARVQLAGRQRSAAAELSLTLVPSSLAVRVVEPDPELVGTEGGY